MKFKCWPLYDAHKIFTWQNVRWNKCSENIQTDDKPMETAVSGVFFFFFSLSSFHANPAFLFPAFQREAKQVQLLQVNWPYGPHTHRMMSELSSRKRTQHRTAFSEMKVTTMLFFQEVNTEKKDFTSSPGLSPFCIHKQAQQPSCLHCQWKHGSCLRLPLPLFLLVLRVGGLVFFLALPNIII